MAAARGRSRLFLKRAEYSPGYFDLWPFDITILITARKINHPMTRNVCREMRERTVQHHLGATCAVAGVGNHFTVIVEPLEFSIERFCRAFATPMRVDKFYSISKVFKKMYLHYFLFFQIVNLNSNFKK